MRRLRRTATKAGGEPAKQITYWSLSSWLAHFLGDPIIGRSMLDNMAAAYQAADEDVDGVHDYFNGYKLCFFCDRGLPDGRFVPLNWSTDGFQFWPQNGYEG